MAERLDGEWRRAVQQAAADPTSPAYVTWLKETGFEAPRPVRSVLLPSRLLVVAGTDLTAIPVPMIGHVTSSYRSAFLGRTFALALIRRARERHGEVVEAPLHDGTAIRATIVDPVVVDPRNERRDG